FLGVLSTVLVIGFALSSCSPPSVDAWDKTQVEREVREMLDAYFTDIQQSGLTAEFAYLDSTEDFFWVPPGYDSALDYDSVRTILEYNASSLQEISYAWNDLQIHPLSRDIATYTGIVLGEISDTSGMKSNVHMLESGTVIRRDDGWKILCGQSRDFPGVVQLP
ncbi:MAG: nuclear transport factor 2 family protein, partial [Bacteroidota bacterium]